MTFLFASSSSPQTITSQSSSSSKFCTASAGTFLKAATTLTPFGTSCSVNFAAEPVQTPRVLVGGPSIAVASGTITSTRIFPGSKAPLILFKIQFVQKMELTKTIMSASAAAS